MIALTIHSEEVVNPMNNSLTVIPAEQLRAISGGHTAELTTIGMIVLGLELPHIFMGIKEFTNYVVDVCQHGADEDDHFSQFFIGMYQSCFGK